MEGEREREKNKINQSKTKPSCKKKPGNFLICFVDLNKINNTFKSPSQDFCSLKYTFVLKQFLPVKFLLLKFLILEAKNNLSTIGVGDFSPPPTLLFSLNKIFKF